MGEETPSIVNLDLNLGHGVNRDEPGSGLPSHVPMSLEEWLERSRRFRESLASHRVIRRRPLQRWRSLWRPVTIPPPPIPPPPIPPVIISPETRDFGVELRRGGDLESGEGSIAPGERLEERLNEENKGGDTNNELENEAAGKKNNVEKSNGNSGSFFDCNVCLDQAREPVVTCCGHLFCWPCLYQWLHVHSVAKECPVCKGQVTMNDLTPIYGRGNDKHDGVDESTLNIPQRPQARRVEGWRQTFQNNAFPVDEMIRGIGNRFDLSRNMAQVDPHPQTSDNPHTHNPHTPGTSPDRSNIVERRNFILNRFLTSRGMQREHNTEDPLDLSRSNPAYSNVGERLRVIRRSHPHRAAMISTFTSALSSAERLVDSYFRNNPSEAGDDRDSVSSIAAVIHSESQTVDNTVEIDSRVSLSTSSSRRRHDASRISDVDVDMDSGDSRAPIRRRLN